MQISCCSYSRILLLLEHLSSTQPLPMLFPLFAMSFPLPTPMHPCLMPNHSSWSSSKVAFPTSVFCFISVWILPLLQICSVAACPSCCLEFKLRSWLVEWGPWGQAVQVGIPASSLTCAWHFTSLSFGFLIYKTGNNSGPDFMRLFYGSTEAHVKCLVGWAHKHFVNRDSVG